MTAPTPTTWQAIESAPADTEILIHTRRWGVIIARFSDEQWLSRMQVPVSIREDDEMPTHWQPLPEPPEGTGENAGAAETGGGPATAKAEGQGGSS